ncbi:MAG TPA: DUF4870 domain-containing protein [Cytophagales bacterium]|nr:DUF4870 domain-containing protein [Cytophagales bacterium]
MRYDDLERLNALREKGAITEDEYQREKEKILNSPAPSSASGNMLGLTTNTYCMFIHLTQLCGYFVPLAGMVVPILLWVLNKEHNPVVDKHGRIVLNWIISSFIYLSILGLLCALIIGIPFFIAFIVANFVFIILGGMKANSGQYYKYPFSIEFVKVDNRMEIIK